MIAKKITMSFLILMCLILVQNTAFSVSTEASEKEKQEYKQERDKIKALRKSLTRDKTNDLKKYEKFADEIQNKWKDKNKEHYARLMLKVCGPLGSGNFKDKRCYDLRRQYALSALKDPNEIALLTELDLTGLVITFMIGPKAPKGADFAQRRKKDVQIRLHAWKRLVDAIDPDWDPNEEMYINVPLPHGVMGDSGMSPKHIKDAVLRAEYEAAIQENRRKNKRYIEQSRLRKWLIRFPKRAEPYIIHTYSKAPFNMGELRKYLDRYMADKKIKARIIDTVTKNIEKQNTEMRRDPKE